MRLNGANMQIASDFKRIIESAKANAGAYRSQADQAMGLDYLMKACNAGDLDYVFAATKDERFLVRAAALSIVERAAINKATSEA